MSIETATYINDLNETYPLSGDATGQGDDHLRLIKAVLKNTFPNLNAAVTATSDQMNYPFPIGGIIVWSGTEADVPNGWGLCNGSAYDRSDGLGRITSPDLRDKFVMGAGTTEAGTTGGATTKTTTAGGGHTPAGSISSNGAHTHSGTTGSHVLTIDELPPHHHSAPGGEGFALRGTGWGVTYGGQIDSGTAYPNTTDTGGGAGHTHTLSSDGSHTHTFTGTAVADHTHQISDVRPPFYALCYIMKI